MKKVLYGSRAAKIWFDDFRDPKDFDYLVNQDLHRDGPIEYKNVTGYPGYQQVYDDSSDTASAETLYTMKLAHCFWSIHWTKTMWDIAFFQNHGVKLDEKLFDLLYADNVVIHGRKRAYLQKDNDEFFKDSVKRKYVHDHIHYAVAYYDEPMYNKVKVDKTKAFVNKELFDALSHEDKVRLCREEISVVALERFLIPKDFAMNTKVAYMGACRLLLTSMTKGWFPRFIAENWGSEFCQLDSDHNFVKLFKNKQPSLVQV